MNCIFWGLLVFYNQTVSKIQYKNVKYLCTFKSEKVYSPFEILYVYYDRQCKNGIDLDTAFFSLTIVYNQFYQSGLDLDTACNDFN